MSREGLGELGIELARSSPDDVLDELDRIDSEESLRAYLELVCWPVIEPGRKFIPGWHLDCMSEHLQAVANGDIIRLNFNVPPGTGKSIFVDAIFPSWLWGPANRPSSRFLSASYSIDLTIRNNRRTRAIINSEKYQKLWGHRFRLSSDQDAKTRFDNDHTGFKIATSVGGLGVGERGDIFIIDDGNNIKDVESAAVRHSTNLWFLEVVPTRVVDPIRSAIINVQQRTHENDISGVILERELGFVNVVLPMEFEPDRRCFVEVTGWKDPRTQENELLWPERMPRQVVERDKRTMGEYAVAGQFQQRPAPRGGGMFKRTWWKFFHTGHSNRPTETDEGPAVALPSTFDQVVMSVDASFAKTTTGSRVGVGVVARHKAFRYVLENRTKHMSFTETVDTIRKLMSEFPKTIGGMTVPRITKVLVEKKANGDAILDLLRPEFPGLVAVNPDGGKEARASMIEPAVRSGNVMLPDGAPWLDDFITEFALFPAGQRDDQVDMLSQALNFMLVDTSVARATMLGKW